MKNALILTNNTIFNHGIATIINELFSDVNIIQHSYPESLKLEQAVTPYDFLLIGKSFYDEAKTVLGQEALQQLMKAQPTLFVSTKDPQVIYDYHRLDIYGYITIEDPVTEIKEAIRACFEGRKYFCQSVVKVLVEYSMKMGRQPKQESLHERLSDREMEIFMMVTQGKSAKEIADKLYLSTHTVYTHRKNILKKLACNSAAELINYAYSQGLLDQE